MRPFAYYILFALLFAGFASNASHIVGGELQMQHQRGESYLLRLILYYDQANAEYNLIDREIELGIFRKTNSSRVDETTLEFSTSRLVDYANPNCLPDTLKTIKIIYEGVYRFNTEKFSDPGGYYITWERCCRNNIISNLRSPGRQGMVFMLEFSSLAAYAGNSSPVFNNISGEYICRDRYIELDYGARDFDGDSLRFSLQVPLAGFTSPNRPQSDLLPGPYPPVEGYFTMPGSPFLQIDEQSGLLSVRPTQNGLYVFRVMCEEFRDGIRIGAINRDFQILVNECEDNFPPETTVLTQDGQPYTEGDTILIDNRDNLCFGMDIIDKNAEDQIIYRIEPINFEEKTPVFSPASGMSSRATDTLNVEVCWPDCEEPEDNGLYQFYLIVEDNACPYRNVDSILVNLKVEEEDNFKPVLEIEEIELSWAVGENLDLWLLGRDQDMEDTLSFSYKLLETGQGNPTNTLFQLNDGNPVDGRFNFLAGCKDLNTEPYIFRFMVSDNSCAGNNTDSVDLQILVDDYIPSELVINEPSNVITPNGDGLNDYFFFNRPPPSACEFQEFEKIVIYNRWGREVFSSTDRDFKWYAREVPAGEYFYLIRFEKTGYKGFIHVLK